MSEKEIVKTQEEAVEAVAPKKKKKKSKKASIVRGVCHIKATYNNTIVSMSDKTGNVVAWSSAGKNGFKGPKKSTPYAASVIVKDVCEKVRELGMQEVDVVIRGVGAGREGAIRALNANGMKVITIKDITPVPHNGCRPPRPRRV